MQRGIHSGKHLPSQNDTDSDLSDRARSSLWNQEPRIREEARALELRVQKAASTKCTFEEVSELRDDIQNWLLTEPKYKPNGKQLLQKSLALVIVWLRGIRTPATAGIGFPALRLSAALLRAILLNSLAYTEASKTSKIVEDGLLDKIKALETQQTVLEAETRRQKQQYSEKSHEAGFFAAHIAYFSSDPFAAPSIYYIA
ncbi:7670_t:CDS:2 [Acaulospora colombiana]|uniref:7670_t:CDS:1 n=1 Tax=Acaulospora colombiana TaxID=27376 RepID=A0ACA9MVF6_9GLOM|nr:7670_t:CDS:2 [Acaulospora colombiana]